MPDRSAVATMAGGAKGACPEGGAARSPHREPGGGARVVWCDREDHGSSDEGPPLEAGSRPQALPAGGQGDERPYRADEAEGAEEREPELQRARRGGAFETDRP